MDTSEEAIIFDLQQNISNNNGGKASRILKAKLKATPVFNLNSLLLSE